MSTRSAGAEALPILLFVVLAGALAWLFFTPRETPLAQSPKGFDGVARWLRAEGADAGIYRGGFALPVEEIGLRILPLYDTDLDAKMTEPQSQRENLMHPDEDDIREGVIRRKASLAPTLIVLPKWKRGVRLTRIVHPVLLDDAAHIAQLRAQLPFRIGPLNKVRKFFDDFEWTSADGDRFAARLYAPQTFEAAGCAPLIGDRQAMLLGRCKLSGKDAGTEIWVLSDPDLLSNHGLALGDNARLAAALLPELAGEGRILVDYTRYSWTTLERTERPERSWSDLGRFFAYPFTLIWVSVALLFALVLWRSWVRIGAPAREEAEGFEASKRAAIDAKARLLRLAGHDGALLAAHVDQRLAAILAEIFGPHAPSDKAPLDALAGFLNRRGAFALADKLKETAGFASSLPPAAAPGEAVRRLDEFEIVLEEVTGDFGRTARRS